MVQELQVLRCFSCETFQSHIVKKTNKWECKVCGIKQSIKKVYGQGSGKDCRIHTQKLNTLKGEKGQYDENQAHEEDQDVDILQPDQQETVQYKELPFNEFLKHTLRPSKWEVFLEEEEAAELKSNCNIQESTTVSSLNTKVKNNTKRKRNFDIFQSDIDVDYGNSDAHNSVDNTYSDFSFSRSHLKQTKKSKNNNKTYKSNVLSECNPVINSFETENTHPTSKLGKLDSKRVPSKVSLKWSKYLESDETQKVQCPYSEEGKTVDDECVRNSVRVIRRVSEVTNCKINVPDESYCGSKYEQPEPVFRENQLQPVFEQTCELNESDFTLDF